MADGKVVLKKIRALRGEFDEAHIEGLEALNRGDFKRLTRVIRREGDIIERQRKVLEYQPRTPKRK